MVIKEYDDHKVWMVDGKLHRLDGPAVEWTDGGKDWYIDGMHLFEEQFNDHPKVCNYLFKLALEEVL